MNTSMTMPRTPGATGLRGVVAIDLASTNGRTGQGPTVFLYGISTFPSSYRNLQPGENARFRISSTVYIAPLEGGGPTGKSRPETREAFTATAVFKLDNSSVRSPFENVRSANHFTITVTVPG